MINDLETNVILIYFFYGLFFFLMGFAIAMSIRAYKNLTDLPLAKSLSVLAVFGITHGIYEWSIAFIYLHYFNDQTLEYALVFKDLLGAVSLTFLFYFGARLTTDTLNKYNWLRCIPLVVFVFWLVNFLAFPAFINGSLGWWLRSGEIWARYMLAFPGAVLSSYALKLQYNYLKFSTHQSIANNFKYAAVIFGIYAVVAGLVVPKAHFFPASLINVETFINTFFVPVQVIRALCGMAMAYFIFGALEVFNLENLKNLEEARGLNLLYQERSRIGRDLHDGIIQQIYAVGLQMENVCYLMDEDRELAKEQVKNSMKALDGAVKDIRNYILDLQPTNFKELCLAKGLSRIIDNFRANSLIHVEFKVVGEERILPEDTCNQIYHIMQESFNNILRHSRATMVELELGRRPGVVEICLKDNGCGFNIQELPNGDGKHRGLANISERCRLIEADWKIDSHLGKGTTVTLEIKTGGNVSGEN